MATILRSSQREFHETPGKIDGFKIMTDISGAKQGASPKQLYFDVRRLNPDQYSCPYHFHRFAEELFMIISGSATLRTAGGLETVGCGDIIFFEAGETGAHQLYNHTAEPCTYLDVRTFTGFDMCEYPDSDKLLIAPSREVFKKDTAVNYFEGEENVRDKWEQIRKNQASGSQVS